MFQNPYEMGIAARKANKGRHENPFIREPTWFEDFSSYTPRKDLGIKKDYWNEGWDAENAAQSAKAKSV